MIYRVNVKGVFETNSYFYIDESTNHGFLIDPGAESKKLLNIVKENNWIIEKILLTHGHFDHFGGVFEIADTLGCIVMAHKEADKYLLDPKMNLSVFCNCTMTLKNTVKFENMDLIQLDANNNFSLRVIETPGHTEDSVVLYSPKDNVAFVGDTIFKNAVGSSDYYGGNKMELINSIKNKIFSLPDNTALYSGHSDKTTVGDEKKFYGLV